MLGLITPKSFQEEKDSGDKAGGWGWGGGWIGGKGMTASIQASHPKGLASVERKNTSHSVVTLGGHSICVFVVHIKQSNILLPINMNSLICSAERETTIRNSNKSHIMK